MSRKIKRDEGGQFAPGHSGNPDGARLRKPKALLTIADLHRIQLEVAGEIVGFKDGKPVTRYENCSRGMVTGGAANRLGSRDFIELTKSSAYFIEREERRRGFPGGRS